MRNFNNLYSGSETVRFPVPYGNLITRNVLVESFEKGDLIMEWMPTATSADKRKVARSVPASPPPPGFRVWKREQCSSM